MKKRLNKKIIIRDETLRDGLQQYGINLSFKDMFNIAKLSAELLDSTSDNVNNQIDLGMPEVSSSLSNFIRETASELASYNIDFFVTGRSTKDAIEAMYKPFSNLDSTRYVIAPFIGISEKHRKKMQLKKSDLYKKIRSSIILAKKYAKRIHFPLEGGYFAYLEDREHVYNIFKLLSDLKIEAVPFCDTNGTAIPFSNGRYVSYGDAIKDLKKKYPDIQIAVHCHNDFGLAVANSLSGLISGASILDGTYLGIGERSGNTSLEVALALLKEKEDSLSLSVQVNIKKLYDTVRKIKELLKVKIADNTPVIGVNAFRHASGVHQDGTLKDKSIYEPYKPEVLGRRGHEIVISYLSGKKGLQYVLKEKYNIVLNEDQINKIAKKFKNEMGRGSDPESGLLKIVDSVLFCEK